ncbi:CDP-alcohol phosphatidyltransferase family protein [Actinopolymorpha sp. NPDC004070]|uniref:CDP-alcohol phosphatidyltransferase family protein n=1 Tax=Actinopolymorpha sp. NPDC004070 TaxID=3154548 RepID=UPI0033A94265
MATMTTSARPERGWQRPEAERLLTGATVVTFVRTVVSVGIALYAAYDRSLVLLLVALAVYWVGDMADGALARLTDTETRIGAVFDIVSDRLCAGAFYVGLVWLEPAMALPVGVFLLEFAVVDTFVSLAFLAWPLRSPNYFHLVDRPIWAANWSKPGKAANSSAVAVLMVVTHSVPLCTAVALCLLAVKIWSLVRLDRLGLPLPQVAGSSDSATRVGQAP